MKIKDICAMTMCVLMTLTAMTVGAEEITKPEPQVPEVFTLTGEFVRVAYNNEGFVTLGYRAANQSQGEEWLLLEVGVTLRTGVKDQTLTRESFSLVLPDGSIVLLATQKEFGDAGYLPALNRRASMVMDSINYFPPEAHQPCAIGFFGDPSTRVRGLSFDQVDLTVNRACRGRIFFNLPGGITAGQYFLNVKFASSLVQVPFRIMTKDEEKMLHKNWKEIKKEHDASNKQ